MEAGAQIRDGKVVVELDLAGLYVDERGTTFAQLVAGSAATKLLATEESRQASRILGERMARIADEEIREQLRPVIAKALELAVQPTDSFGTAKGAPTTLHERIVALARKELTEKRGDAFRGKQTTLVEDFVKVEVRDALGRELQEVVREAKADVLAAVRERAGEVIAETIERVAAGRSV